VTRSVKKNGLRNVDAERGSMEGECWRWIVEEKKKLPSVRENKKEVFSY